MIQFRKILVGVDLTPCRSLEAANLGRVALDTVACAHGLARACAADLTFFSAFNLTEDALHQLDPEDRSSVRHTIEERARGVLEHLAQPARGHGIAAHTKIALGKGWLEIIREVLRGHHDLVLVGTRDQTGFRRMLFGNTAMKLLRRCPCPVWVVKQGMRVEAIKNILVATDLKPTSEQALAAGISLANALHADLHVLHAVEFPLDRLGFTGLTDEKTHQYHQRVRAHAEKQMCEQLQKAECDKLGERCRMHIAENLGIADATIQHFLESHKVDLLIMGTIGRTGLAGFFIGNTAERLLPEVHCSLLAVKPPDFHCRVEVDETTPHVTV
jgi:universal stress protein E